jgi:hypothetical protein
MEIRRNPLPDARRFWCCACQKYLSNRSSMKRHIAEFHGSRYTLMREDPRAPDRYLCAPWDSPVKPSKFPYRKKDWGEV